MSNKKNSNDFFEDFGLFLIFYWIITSIGKAFKEILSGIVFVITKLWEWASKPKKSKKTNNSVIEKEILNINNHLLDISKLNNLFETPIIERGNEYFYSGRITGVKEKSPTEYSAIAKGTEEYQVDISLEEKDIKEAKCTCPYFKSEGKMCKHIYATLRAIVLTT